jgi:ketosteroid isomerase-like protein
MSLTTFNFPSKYRAISLIVIALTFFTGCDMRHERDREYIEKSESQWAESVATNDASVVERILDDDFVWITPSGTKMNKARMVADARNGPGPFVSNHVEGVTVRFYGRTAVAQGSEAWVQRDASGEKKGRFVWTDVWVKRDDRWKIVAAQDLAVPVKD